MGEAARARATKLLPPKGPVRVLATSTLINTLGNGLFVTIQVIFLTRSVGLSPRSVGLGFTIATAIAVLPNIPVGHLADRIDIKSWIVGSQIAQGIFASLFVFIHGFGLFLILTILVEVIGVSNQTLRMTLIARMAGIGEARVRTRAYLRSVVNLGIGAGATLAGVALAIDTRTAYETVILVNGVTFVVAALILLRLPDLAPTSVDQSQLPTTGKRFIALRDKRYMAATMLNGVFAMHFVIQNVGIPLWIINFTHAPRWTVSAVLVTNTIACVLFSVRASKGTGEVHGAARIFFRAGIFVAAGCVIYSFAQGAKPILATALLIGGMLFHVTGELLGSAAGWGMGYELAREELLGQYQGVWQLGVVGGSAIGPALITFLVVDLQRIGWFIMAAVFVTTTFLLIPVVRSYRR